MVELDTQPNERTIMPKYKVSATTQSDFIIEVEANSQTEAENQAMQIPMQDWENLGFEFSINFTEEVK